MDKIDSLLKELALEEKVLILSGSDAWHSTPVERLAIPRIKMTDVLMELEGMVLVKFLLPVIQMDPLLHLPGI